MYSIESIVEIAYPWAVIVVISEALLTMFIVPGFVVYLLWLMLAWVGMWVTYWLATFLGVEMSVDIIWKVIFIVSAIQMLFKARRCNIVSEAITRVKEKHHDAKM